MHYPKNQLNRTRRDGESTRERILEAASLVFGQKGYHKATHAEISRVAGVNAALINFHFCSKDNLYREVWECVDAGIESIYPIDGGIPGDAPPSSRLRGLISCLLNRALDPQLEGYQRILSMEILNPTGLLDNILTQRRNEHRARLLAILGELLGPKADEKSIELCEMSIISQCRIIIPRYTGRWSNKYSHSDVKALTEHIALFSLAGIEAIKKHSAGIKD